MSARSTSLSANVVNVKTMFPYGKSAIQTEVLTPSADPHFEWEAKRWRGDQELLLTTSGGERKMGERRERWRLT